MRLSPRPRTRLRRIALAGAALVLAAPVVPLAGALGSPQVVTAAGLSSASEEVAADAAAALRARAEWERVGSSRRLANYVTARDRAARMAATELELDPEAMALAWAEAHPTKQVALLAALTQLGVPYRYNTSIEGEGFDCSGLTTYAYARAGIELRRSSGTQISDAEVVERHEAEAGDLVHYPGHIMMWLGVGDAVVHSRQPGSTVEMTFVSERRSDTVTFGTPVP